MLSSRVGRAKVFATIFEHVLRREFLHASAADDWRHKVPLLEGAVHGLQTLVEQARSSLPLTQYDASVYFADLATRIVAAADGHIRQNASTAYVMQQSARTLTGINLALEEVSRLVVLFEWWQVRVDASASDSKESLPVSRALAPESLFYRAVGHLEDALVNGEDAVRLCMKDRHLFLVYFFGWMVDPRWTPQAHERVVALHERVAQRMDEIRDAAKLRGYDDEVPLIDVCQDSTRWRQKQLQSEFRPEQLDELAGNVEEPLGPLATFRDRPAAGLPLEAELQSGSLLPFRVLALGPRDWLAGFDSAVTSLVALVSRGLMSQLSASLDLRKYDFVLLHESFLAAPQIHSLWRTPVRVVVCGETPHSDWPLSWVSEDRSPTAHRIVGHVFLSRERRSHVEDRAFADALKTVTTRLAEAAATNLACHILDQWSLAQTEKSWPARHFHHLHDFVGRKHGVAGEPFSVDRSSAIAERRRVLLGATDRERVISDNLLFQHGFSRAQLTRDGDPVLPS